MLDKILSGEVTPEKYIKRAEERRKEWENRMNHEEERFCHDRKERCFRECEGRSFHGPKNMPFGGFGGRSFQGPKNMPFHGPKNMPHLPRLPKDDSLNSLLFFAAYAVRPRPVKGKGGMEGMAQHRVLKLLGETSSISQQSLQEILAIRPGSLSELLSKLENKGLILRTQDETDRRKNTLSLTDAGREALKETEERRDPFNMLTDEEQEALKALLKKIIEGNSELPKTSDEKELI